MGFFFFFFGKLSGVNQCFKKTDYQSKLSTDELCEQTIDFGHIISNKVSVDPAFLAIMRFPLKRRDSFFYLKQKKPFLENGLESPLIFVFILKGKTK